MTAASHPDFGAIEILRKVWAAPIVREITGRSHLGAHARATPGFVAKPHRVRTKAALFEIFVDSEYHASPARYAKGMMKITTPSRDGYKTRAARLAEAVARGRWTNREGAYVLSPAAAARFVKLYAEGYDASPITGELREPSHA